MFQHTAARRRLVIPITKLDRSHIVSTHSRPKAAGSLRPLALLPTWFQHTAARRRLDGLYRKQTACRCFNTQPPEGGWKEKFESLSQLRLFQHTAARRRLDVKFEVGGQVNKFQHTAARRRLGQTAC